jgi:hypothetical protein
VKGGGVPPLEVVSSCDRPGIAAESRWRPLPPAAALPDEEDDPAAATLEEETDEVCAAELEIAPAKDVEAVVEGATIVGAIESGALKTFVEMESLVCVGVEVFDPIPEVLLRGTA